MKLKSRTVILRGGTHDGKKIKGVVGDLSIPGYRQESDDGKTVIFRAYPEPEVIHREIPKLLTR